MADSARSRRRALWLGIGALSAGCAVSLCLAGAGLLPAWSRAPFAEATPPPLVIRLTPYTLSAEITNNPVCSTLMLNACPVVAPANSPAYVTFWIKRESAGGASIRRLLEFPIP